MTSNDHDLDLDAETITAVCGGMTVAITFTSNLNYWEAYACQINGDDCEIDLPTFTPSDLLSDVRGTLAGRAVELIVQACDTGLENPSALEITITIRRNGCAS